MDCNSEPKRLIWHNRYTWICSAHFISGAKSDDPLSPIHVPTVFSYVESLVKRKGAQNLARYERGTAAKKRKKKSLSDSGKKLQWHMKSRGTVV